MHGLFSHSFPETKNAKNIEVGQDLTVL